MVNTLNAEQVRRQLALPESTLDRITRIGSPGRQVDLPGDAEADRLLQLLGVQPDDRRDTLAARPDPVEHPELWWILSVLVDELITQLDQPIPTEGFKGWPALPRELGAQGRHLYVWAFLVATPLVRRVHTERGIDDEVSWTSLSLTGALARHREVTGESGIGLIGQWSIPLRFRGADYAMGRHEFTRARMSLGGGAEEGGHVLMVHVPPAGRLDEQSSTESLDRARDFFPRHYPEEPVAAFTCVSWLLDPQLAEYLPHDSNILRFQRRFRLLPHLPSDDQFAGDRQLLAFTFNRPAPEGGLSDEVLDGLPQETTFQRAYVTHLRAGRHWHSRTGCFPFSST